VKLKYKDFVKNSVVAAINQILAIRPAPLASVSHSFVINIRRINAKIADFMEAQKAIARGHQEKVMQFKAVLFFVPENADIDSVVGLAKDKARLRRAVVDKEKRDDGSEIYELDWMPMDQLENLIATNVFELIDQESLNAPTEPLLIDGMWNFIVLLESAEREWIFKKSKEQFQLDIEELLDTEIEVEIRVVTNEMLEKSEEKRPGFAVPADNMLITWFMFEQE